jgi:uncharacterized protein YbcC (UPF0753/DUF2309 family)
MPGRERGIIACFRDYLSVAPSLLAPWLMAAKRRLDSACSPGADTHEIAEAMLTELGVAPTEYLHFVSRILLELPGFTGMVSRLETMPADRDPGAPACSLGELMVLRLALDLEAYRVRMDELGIRQPVSQLAAKVLREPQLPDAAEEADRVAAVCLVCRELRIDAEELEGLGSPFVDALLSVVDAFDSFERRRVWHEAYEREHLREVLDALAYHGERGAPPSAENPRFQVVFCIDDREESIRRYFEEQSAQHVTFGVAGFFGVAMRFRGLDDPDPRSLCPVVVEPAHAVHETPIEEHAPASARRTRMRKIVGKVRHELGDASRSLTRGVALTPVLGILAVVPLTLRLLFPRSAARLSRWISARYFPAPRTELVLARPEEPAESTEQPTKRRSLPLGFTLRERVDRVQDTLENMGLVSHFATIVAMLGHGASTVNNPHHSAYDCGACGGRNGGPNGRAFAAMANEPAVRDELRTRGIDIPDSTWFVGGFHDTTTDGITIFDEERIPEKFQKQYEELTRCLDEARKLSAHERCRKFEHAPSPRTLSPEQALRHVEERAVDLSQARPELGHVTNAVCIVGRRELSRGLFLDRRAFLASYDATSDKDELILERVLGAVVPVGAGINLEYYFSTVDNEGYGCGSKLPHNLSCLLGVMEGATGDLRTGLPRQMIEIHEPVRLLSVIEATPEAILEVCGRKPELAELVGKDWVRVVSVHPETGVLAVFQDGAFVPYVPERRSLPSVPTAADWYLGKLGFLPPARIGKRERAA